jgi:DNA-binding transcriptional MerR regulator
VGNRSIGEVLEALKGDFPDISVSKIRFLESQGLVAPQRTASGYRQFCAEDLDLLRWILTQQRDHYLPLKVIRSRLRDGAKPWLDPPSADPDPDPEAVPAVAEAEPAAPLPAVADPDPAPAPAPDPNPAPAPAPDPEKRPAVAAAVPDALPAEDRTYTRSELARAAGLDEKALDELASFGLLTSRLDDHALQVARLAGAFFAYGVEARHLRMYKSMAEREATFFEQVIQPVSARRSADAGTASDALSDLANLGGALRDTLLRQALGPLGKS